MSSFDFAAQEQENLGRGSRVPRVTPCMREYQAKLAETRTRQTSKAATSTLSGQAISQVLVSSNNSNHSNETAADIISSMSLSPAEKLLLSDPGRRQDLLAFFHKTVNDQSLPAEDEEASELVNGPEADLEDGIEPSSIEIPVTAPADDDITVTSIPLPQQQCTPVQRKATRTPRCRAHLSPEALQASFERRPYIPPSTAASTNSVPTTPIAAAGAKRSFSDMFGGGSSGDRDPDDGSNNEAETASPNRRDGYRISLVPPSRQPIIKLSYIFFRKEMSDFDAFPTDISVEVMAKRAYTRALRFLQDTAGFSPIVDDPTSIELALIRDRACQLRGRVKRIAREAVEEAQSAGFKFQSPNDPASIVANRELYEQLKERKAFLYKNPFDIAQKGTLLRNEIIFTIIKKTFFDDHNKSEGLRSGFFEDKAIPIPCLALIMTAYECALDEWRMGAQQPINFTGKIYERVYNMHVKSLRDWEEFSRTRTQAFYRVQQDLFRSACLFAGVSNPDGSLLQETPSLDVSAFAADE